MSTLVMSRILPRRCDGYRPGMSREVSRRSLIGGAVAGLAACSSSGSPTPSPTPSPSPSPSPRPSAVRALEQRLTGRVLRPGSSGYASAARLYNPRYDGQAGPAALAQVASTKDVEECVRWATETGTPLRVRAGGHSYGGWSSGPGLVLDLRSLSRVTVAGDRARIGAGALLAHVYGSLAAQGKSLAAGSCPTVGFSGLALGGGVGVLTRAYGLTCDAVTGANVVTADGSAHQADDDLLWALRGGGGSFGAVTEWEVSVRPAPTVMTFYLGWDLDHGADVLAAWQTWMRSADKRLWSTCKLLSGKRSRALVAGTWIGPASGLDGQLAPLLKGLPAPTSRSRRTRSYGDAMLFEAGCAGLTTRSCLDAGMETRKPFTATSLVLRGTFDGYEQVLTAARRAADVPGMVEGGLSFDALGGAVTEVAIAESAFPWRLDEATVQVTATWDRGSATPYDEYVHGVRRDLQPLMGDHAYSSYADAGIRDYAKAYWGPNVDRLRQVKRAVDPHDLFSWPQSVRG
jgi:FAD/FMN-containing dehydrogenase